MPPFIDVRHGDCREVLNTLTDATVDACVTDPPYALTSIAARFGKASIDDATRAGRVRGWTTRPPGRHTRLELDPFAGTGTTGIAARACGFDSILVEADAEYVEDIKRRIEFFGLRGSRRREQPSKTYGRLF